jgi:hypothetical protein
MGGACTKHGKHEKLTENFGLMPEGEIPFGGPRRRSKDNIEKDLKGIIFDGVYYSVFTRLKIVICNVFLRRMEPSGSVKGENLFDLQTINFSRMTVA